MQDPIKLGLASGWKHVDASTLAKSQTIEADVIIVGTGAGGKPPGRPIWRYCPSYLVGPFPQSGRTPLSAGGRL